jgi:hypothetical protein
MLKKMELDILIYGEKIQMFMIGIIDVDLVQNDGMSQV